MKVDKYMQGFGEGILKALRIVQEDRNYYQKAKDEMINKSTLKTIDSQRVSK